MPRLARILLYPVKSLPAVEVERATIADSGALLHDREYALVDVRGQFFNGKLRPAVHRLDATVALAGDVVKVDARLGSGQVAVLLGEHATDAAAFERALGAEWGEPIRIVRNRAGGFPDDTDAPGPTVIAAASLAEVAGWFPGAGVAGMRRRFRANLELDDAPAFWEDRLYAASGGEVAFRVGEVQFLGVNPCQRCVVPTRDPATGEVWPGFQRTFVAKRRASLPPWAPPERFELAYRLCVNTRAAAGQGGRSIRVGDPVELL